jgi:hypothetical protein
MVCNDTMGDSPSVEDEDILDDGDTKSVTEDIDVKYND